VARHRLVKGDRLGRVPGAPGGLAGVDEEDARARTVQARRGVVGRAHRRRVGIGHGLDLAPPGGQPAEPAAHGGLGTAHGATAGGEDLTRPGPAQRGILTQPPPDDGHLPGAEHPPAHRYQRQVHQQAVHGRGERVRDRVFKDARADAAGQRPGGVDAISVAEPGGVQAPRPVREAGRPGGQRLLRRLGGVGKQVVVAGQPVQARPHRLPLRLDGEQVVRQAVHGERGHTGPLL
jgi:hypothetical protein